MHGVEAKTGGKKTDTVRMDNLPEELEDSRDVGGHRRRMWALRAHGAEGHVSERRGNCRSEVPEQVQGAGIHNLGRRVFLRQGQGQSFLCNGQKTVWA